MLVQKRLLLDEQIKQHFSIETQNAQVESIFPHPIALILFHIDEFRADGYTKEELKCEMKQKILNSQNIRVSCTCVRVQVTELTLSINADLFAGKCS